MALVIPTIFTAVNKFSSPVGGMANDVSKAANKMQQSFTSIDNSINKTISSFASFQNLLVAAPIALIVNEAVKFEDRMADVAKTTGLAGKNLEFLSEGILDYSKKTRTSIEELQKIAAIGGQQGILGEQNILNYTKAVDKFSVALGGDFGGDVATATQAISGLNKLFKETRELAPDKSITQVGSAMNALSAKGVLVPNLNEFALRIGQLPDAIKPTIQNTLALGAVLDKSKIPAEIAARAYGDFVTTASKNLPGFAKQMGVTTEDAKKLINTKPEIFLAKFSQSLKGMNAQDISKKLEGLKIGDTGTIKLVGALASNLEMLQQFTSLSNDEFAKGTSLLDEYNKVNSTTAAKLAQAKNNFQALSITIGTELLPVVTPLLNLSVKLAPAIFALGAAYIAWKGVILATNAALFIQNIRLGINSALMGESAFATWGNVTAYGAFRTAVLASAAAQWVLNNAIMASGIGALVIGVGLLSVALYKAFGKNEDLNTSLGVTKKLSDDIIVGIKNRADIEKQAAKEIYLTNAKGLSAEKAKAEYEKTLAAIESRTAKSISNANIVAASLPAEKARVYLGAGRYSDDADLPEAYKPAINSEKARQNAMVSRTESTQKQNVSIDINDNTGRANVSSSNDMVPITTTRTLGGGLSNKL